jgi:hypothetical protein
MLASDSARPDADDAQSLEAMEAAKDAGAMLEDDPDEDELDEDELDDEDEQDEDRIARTVEESVSGD